MHVAGLSYFCQCFSGVLKYESSTLVYSDNSHATLHLGLDLLKNSPPKTIFLGPNNFFIISKLLG